jgi:hypothetical protein
MYECLNECVRNLKLFFSPLLTLCFWMHSFLIRTLALTWLASQPTKSVPYHMEDLLSQVPQQKERQPVPSQLPHLLQRLRRASCPQPLALCALE